ncbi:MAG: diguanylate cyclase [Planctomycetes bacterium]|nr:diguanylate cyclase [Planctomycetota bacterium]
MGSTAFEEMKRTGRLPSPKGVALELMRLLESDDTSIKQITTIVETDPVISSRLLKMVNSPLAGVSRTIASLAMAVNLLGRPAVRNLVLGMSLLESGKNGDSKQFDYQMFWSESLARAVSARHLAPAFGGCAPDEAFTVALLSRIGSLGFAFTYPDLYDEHLANAENMPIAERLAAQRELFGIDQGELSAEMMVCWHLAEVFCTSVRHQDVANYDVGADDDRSTKIVKLLQLAGAFAATFVRDKIYSEDLAELLVAGHTFGLKDELLSDAFDSAKEEWRELGTVFSVATTTDLPSLRDAHSRASRDLKPILVVDDCPVILHKITKDLNGAGYEVRTAANGYDALQAIRSEGYQLVLTDWYMPKMDGLQLCGALRENEVVGFVYVVVLTSSANSEILERAFEAGADDFLVKPWKKIELLARLKAGVRTLNLESTLAAEQREAHKTNAELASLNGKLQRMAITDELTDLHNRREAMNRLREYWAMAKRENNPLACMALDIDHFKHCNDTHGHDAGDAVLRGTSQILKRAVRASESVFRIGGEEFLVLCPNSTLENAAAGAERIRAAVEANTVQHNDLHLKVRVSVGVAQIDDDMAHCEELLKVADKALYEAKDQGRNRVVTSHREPAIAT